MEKKEHLIKTIDIIMNMSVEYYRKIFKTFYPAFGGNGLTERNQSFNFCRHYIEIVKDAVVWQELPIKYNIDGKEIKGHIDSLIIDHTNKIILLIEAKRITKGAAEAKVRSINKDYERLCGNCEFPYHKNDNHNDYEIFVVILADIWCHKSKNDTRTDIFNNWNILDNKLLVSSNMNEVNTPCGNETYYIGYRLYRKIK